MTDVLAVLWNRSKLLERYTDLNREFDKQKVVLLLEIFKKVVNVLYLNFRIVNANSLTDIINTLNSFIINTTNTLNSSVINVNSLIVITEVIDTLDSFVTKTSDPIKVTNKIDTLDSFITNKATYLVDTTYNRFITNAKFKDLMDIIDTYNSFITDKNKL